MRQLTVHAGHAYDILIEKGLLTDCGRYIRPLTQAARVMLITDSNVKPLYEPTVRASLEGAGFQVTTHSFPAGESSKKPGTVLQMVDHMAQAGLTRKDIVVALGGGVTGDMAGFAAAIYLRGIDFVQIPTTLLSQIDSSVGGKTGVDLPQGKNLCGAFHQPILVLIDPLVLDTLSRRFFHDGLAEAIKHGCIKSEAFFERLMQEDPHAFIVDLIYESVNIKRLVVERDEKEQGERALLNFGHTIGHAIEKCHNFTGITHGEAVGVGMVMVTKMSEEMGITKVGTAAKIQQMLLRYDLPFQDHTPVDQLIAAMGMDKKRTGTGIDFVFLHQIGESLIRSIPTDEMKGLLKQWEQ